MLDVADVTDQLEALALLELVRLRLVKHVAVAAPAAGAEWVQAVPGGASWELVSVRFSFVASAVVANRIPNVALLTADGAETLRMGGGNPIAAGSTWVVVYSQVGARSAGSPTNIECLPAPAPVLLPGEQLRSVTTAIDVADQYGGIVLTVREWSIDGVRAQRQWLERHLR